MFDEETFTLNDHISTYSYQKGETLPVESIEPI